MLRKLSWLLVVFFLMTALLSCQKSGSSPDVGKPALPISLKDFEGNTVTLESLKGKVVIVNFWGST